MLSDPVSLTEARILVVCRFSVEEEADVELPLATGVDLAEVDALALASSSLFRDEEKSAKSSVASTIKGLALTELLRETDPRKEDASAEAKLLNVVDENADEDAVATDEELCRSSSMYKNIPRRRTFIALGVENILLLWTVNASE